MIAKIPDHQNTSTIFKPEESREYFDQAIQQMLGISGEEFLRRYDAGEYAGLPDTPEYWPILRATYLISFGRQES